MNIYLSKDLFETLEPGDMFEGHTVLPGLTNEPTCFVYEETSPNKQAKVFGVFWFDMRIGAAEARLNNKGEVQWGVVS